MNDPYASPADSPASISSDEPLFTVAHVALATFLGGPLSGGVLMYINSKRLGIDGAAPLGFTALITLLLMGISAILPDSIPGLTLSIFGLAATSAVFRSLQEEPIQAALTAGRPAGSWLAVLGISVALCAAQVAALFSVLMVMASLVA